MQRVMNACRKVIVVTCVGLMLATLTSCRFWARPAKDMPPVPEVIRRGERMEPVINVYMHETGDIRTMSMEEYLLGVVAAEMAPDWPLEALAAQAIVARTFTLEKIARQGGVPGRNAHASTDIQEFQAYNAERINDQVRQAVQKTRGRVLAYGGKFVRAWFHAYCAGQTSTAADGLAFREFPTPYVKSVTDICPAITPLEEREYSVTFTRAEIIAALRQIGQTPGDFSRVEVLKKDPAGRAVSVRIGRATVSAPALRIALGSTRLRSTKWDRVEADGDRFLFAGTGYGHGVGMCQWGAKARAQRGDNYEVIVKHFFPTATLGTIWD
ncbi:MAG: SpoIID/LytB domain-containing protein [Firmicutes bacterium]|nr:SpoIID/LytB domain-containing protein [Dethiobacter sp.]MBS3889461.1 SpoIID/LytB domain-containing protein [Bacillota bacterium]